MKCASRKVSILVVMVQPAYKDADSTSTALQAAAPIGVTEFYTEKLLLSGSAVL